VIRRSVLALADFLRLVWMSGRLVAGRRPWLPALLPLTWPAFQAFLILTGARDRGFPPESAQGTLIGLPLSVLAIFLGVRVIAGEIDQRRLEIAYTVPGGAHRVWLGKLVAAWSILLVGEILLASVAWAFFTPFPAGSLYGALQACSVYLVLSMGLAALVHSEVGGALVAVTLLAANGVLTGFGNSQVRVSPFWNPYTLHDLDPVLVLAWTVQNRIGFALATAALAALAFAHAERRERLLAG